MAETAVLVNEFGEIGIDHLLFEALDDDILLLAAGCLCCTRARTCKTRPRDPVCGRTCLAGPRRRLG